MKTYRETFLTAVEKEIDRRWWGLVGRLFTTWVLAWPILLGGSNLGIPGWEEIFEKWYLLNKAFLDLVLAARWWIPSCFFAWAFGSTLLLPYLKKKLKLQSKD